MDLGAILDIIKLIWISSGKCVKYHRGLNENMKTLEDKLEELNGRKSDIESETRPELHHGQILKQEVVIWLQKVQEFNDDKRLQQKFDKVKFLSRAYLGRKVAKKIVEVEQHHQKGSFSDGLMVDAAPGRGEMLLTTTLVGETAGVKMEEIWTSLVSDDVQRIGVYGMGGSGKSTIMKHIHNKILERSDKFDHVYWITVSKATSVIKLQDGIASALGFNGLEKIEDEVIRASTLSRKLKEKKRCVLIFDDMWEAFNLVEIGIPEPTVGFRCKLILTTRSLDVCRKMNSRCIEMKLLSDDEAWALFLENVERRDMTSEVETIAKLVAKECARLPLAIIAVGTSMKGVVDKPEWRDTLKKLRDSTKGLDEMKKVIEQLTFSYTRLKDEKAQRCLLYCALYPEDSLIARHELIPLLIAEEIIEGMESSREEGFDEWHAILNKLENACLLESYTHSYFGTKKYVKMHDVIRDMALQIMGVKSMVDVGLQLSEFPSEEKWTEVLETVSLIYNNIIPIDASPRCSKLKTLRLLDSTRMKMIPDSFFVHMPSLFVLDLSYSAIEILPNAISDLENLTALMLGKCTKLYYVPSLAKLRRLRMLDLCHTKIEEVPEGMEMLANLQYLNLFTEHLKTFPSGILPKLTRLQCLILNWGSETLYMKGEELISLKKLERLECQFYDLNDFNLYVRSLEHHQRRLPKSYNLYVGSGFYCDPFYADADDGDYKKSVRYGIRREGEAESKSEESILQLQNDVEDLRIQNCDDVRSLSDVRLCAASSHSPLLLHCTFSCLRKLRILNCRNIKRLFTPGLAPHLQNLEEIIVESCEGMEEIVAEEEEEEGTIKNDHNFSITLPKLKTMFLCNLPELKCIMCRRGVMVCDSIVTIEIFGCPKVKRLPLYLPLNRNGQPSPPGLVSHLQNLEEIIVERCEGMEEIVAGEEEEEGTIKNDHNFSITLPKLKTLRLSRLPELKCIMCRRGVMVCDSIQTIKISGCPKVKRLPLYLPLNRNGQPSPPGLVSHLQNLEEIYVERCEGMEEIVAGEEEEEGMIKNDHNFSITLPKLKTLCLYILPELKCIMRRRGVVMVCDSIETIQIFECPKVKTLPLYLPLNPNGQPSPPPLLTSIIVVDEWWNLLEWDNPIAKDVLQPFIKFSTFWSLQIYLPNFKSDRWRWA